MILLFLVCANLSVGLVVGFGFAGTEYVNPLAPELDPQDYEDHFDADALAEGWESTPFSGIPIVGDIFAGFNFLWQNIQYLVDGLPILLTYFSDAYLVGTEAQTAFGLIAGVLRAIYAILISVFLIEFISGRNMSD